MKHFRYRTGLKVLLIALQQIFTVLLVVSIVLLSSLFEKKMLDTNDIFNQSFTDSGYYEDVFQESVQEIMRYVTLKEQFEIDGVYDENKVIDIFSYADGRTVSGQKIGDENEENEEDKRIKYRLGDLLDWAGRGYEEDENGLLIETYTPLSGKSIWQCVEDGSMDYDEARRIGQMTEQVLDSIKTDINLYKRYLNKYDVNESNVKYWICKGNNSIMEYSVTDADDLGTVSLFMSETPEVYSNMEDNKAQKEIANALEGRGSYFYYDDLSLHMKTNVDGMEDYFYEQLEYMAEKIGNNPVILISVDTKFPYQDSFAEANQDFQKYHPWIIAGIFLLACSGLSTIMALVLLTTAAGRAAGQENVIRTCWFDKIKTEFIFAALFLFIVLTTIATVQIAYGNWKIPGMLIMAGVMTYVCDSIFLILYLSIVRRMKAEILWTGSLVFWIYSGIKKVIGNWKLSVRIILLFVVENFLFLWLAYHVFISKSFLAAVALIAFMIGNAVFMLKESLQRDMVIKGIDKIAEGNLKFKIDTEGLYGSNQNLAIAINNIGDGLYRAVDENTKNERMKADLITNVSHDIKTPLTSIINYVNLIKMENIKDDKLKEYVDILDSKAQRLRQLTEDLVEASKISSGNIELHMECIDFVELVYQTGGEFNEKFEAKDLTTITKLPQEPVLIMADGRRIWRVIENLYNNVAKYALAHTRVYVTVKATETQMEFSIKNISEQEIKVDTSELTERFIRGDTARTTEGSGLGLSIARNLTVMMDGEFSIGLDGDLFKVSVCFPRVK